MYLSIIQSTPSIAVYTENPRSLPFEMRAIIHLTQAYPVTAAKTQPRKTPAKERPARDAPSTENISSTRAPRMAGILIRNEKRAVAWRDMPQSPPEIMPLPLLDTPGRVAMPWNRPINNASRWVMAKRSRLPEGKNREKSRKREVTMKQKPKCSPLRVAGKRYFIKRKLQMNDFILNIITQWIR